MLSSSSLLLTASFIASISCGANGFHTPSVGSAARRVRSSPLHAHDNSDNEPIAASSSSFSRHRFLATTASALIPVLTATAAASPSHALVKGNAPPPKKKASDGGGGGEALKCRNVEECQEMAEIAETQRAAQEAERAASGPKPQIANGVTKYLDIEVASPSGASENGAVVVAKAGDAVDIHYRVLKLGKRSYDGLSGEGTVVFSRGYALEDDEKTPGDHSFKFKLGDARVIRALNDAVPGMAVGGTRRISVTPRNGWEKNTRECDGGPGGSGAGGELKTDYVVVPTATMVEQEACFDKTKLPFPATYAQERRMAQRFDQSLIVEVRLVNVL